MGSVTTAVSLCTSDAIEPKPAVAFCNEKVDIYVADKLTKSVQQLDEEEYINVEYYTLQELKDMIMNGIIEDSKTISAILAYEQTL